MDSELLAALTVAVLSFVGAVTVALIQRNSQIHADVKATRDQVQNSHSTNLRDDIDALHETARMAVIGIEHVREELCQEREERMALSARLEEQRKEHQTLKVHIDKFISKHPPIGESHGTS